jgi:glucose/arabinose dehydrogenase
VKRKAEVENLLYIVRLSGTNTMTGMKTKSSVMKMLIFLIVGAATVLSVFWNDSFDFVDDLIQPSDLPIDQIKLPEGFEISVYAEVPNARSMAVSPGGTLFVGNRSEDNVYAVVDTNKDMVADRIYVIDKDLKMPNGVAFKDGDLYVAEVNRILRYRNIESNLDSPPEPEVVFDGYPTERHHGWKYIAFGPDGKLYVPVGAPCNICENEDKPIFASITRIDVDNPKPEIIAHGVRNSVGFDWDPKTGDLWFTDNGRDMMGDDVPPCELNHVKSAGEHFGYPYCHGGTIPDPEFGQGKDCKNYSPPAYKFGAHVAPLGMTFYTGNVFPKDYLNAMFVAQHGSWNRSKKSGYKVMMVQHNGTKATKAITFAEGWLDHESQKAWGRPVDVLGLADGSILISDDYAGVIYRVTYKN